MSSKIQQYPTSGVFYYEEKPEKIQSVTWNNFFDNNGKLKVGKWFLLHSYYTNHYEAYKINEDLKEHKLHPFLSDGRIFMHEKDLR